MGVCSHVSGDLTWVFHSPDKDSTVYFCNGISLSEKLRSIQFDKVIADGFVLRAESTLCGSSTSLATAPQNSRLRTFEPGGAQVIVHQPVEG